MMDCCFDRPSAGAPPIGKTHTPTLRGMPGAWNSSASGRHRIFVKVAMFVASAIKHRAATVGLVSSLAANQRSLCSSLADFRSPPPSTSETRICLIKTPVTRSSRFHLPHVDKIRMSVAEHFSESKFSSTSHAVESGNIAEIAVHKSSPRCNNRRASTKPVFLLASLRQTAMEV
jgi:hypothetical protein